MVETMAAMAVEDILKVDSISGSSSGRRTWH
jgi:hypothetical protein